MENILIGETIELETIRYYEMCNALIVSTISGNMLLGVVTVAGIFMRMCDRHPLPKEKIEIEKICSLKTATYKLKIKKNAKTGN